jgi:hypothetical protein
MLIQKGNLMSLEGTNIVSLISEVRNLCEQVAMLLGTADQIVKKENWKSANGSTVTGGNSASINNPRAWVPEFLCRFYVNENFSQLLFYLAVILDNREKDKDYPPKSSGKFDEPIITAGYYDYGDKKVEKWDLWQCRLHVYSDDPDYNGEIFTTIPKETISSVKDRNFKQLISLAIPLINVIDSSYLEVKIIDPLFQHIETNIKKG